jgi:hypothetical protein
MRTRKMRRSKNKTRKKRLNKPLKKKKRKCLNLKHDFL